MKNRSAGLFGRLFFNAVTLESRSPGSVVINKESGRDAGLKLSSMTLCDERRSGFTLIELLVVVLIIGILSAVALPQYQKAVEKSRAAEALTNLRAIVNAMQISKMANGVPAEKLEDLDVSLPGEKIDERTVKLKNFTYYIRISNGGPEGFEVVATRNDTTTDARKYYIYFNYNGGWSCVAMTKAAEAPCATVCASSEFLGHMDNYTVCSIK